MKKKIWLIFLLPLFLYSSSTDPGKLVEQRLQNIEKQSHRKIKIFSRSEVFSQKDLNSYLEYRIKNTTKSASLEIKDARVKIGKDRFVLSLVAVANEPLPFIDMEVMSLKVLPIGMQFSIEQKSGKYRLKIHDFRIGKAVPSERLALLILSRLKASTGFNFDVKTWEKFPFGIKKITQKEGEVKVYY